MRTEVGRLPPTMNSRTARPWAAAIGSDAARTVLASLRAALFSGATLLDGASSGHVRWMSDRTNPPG